MKKKIIIAVGLIIAILWANVVITFATEESDLKNKQNDIQNQINEANQQKGEVEEEIKDTLKQIQSLTSEISQFENQIEELDTKLSSLETSISETQAKLKEAEGKYDEQLDALQSRIVAQYEAGETTYLDVILGGGSLLDMISNWQLVSDIAEIDNRLLAEIEENRKQIEEAKNTLETSKTQVQNLKNSKVATTNSLKNSQAAKEKQVSELDEKDKELQAEIDRLNKENAQVKKQLEEAARKYSNQIANLGGDGTFQRPVKAGEITATMYYSSGAYHGALDYGVPVGTTVYAAGDGVVLARGWRVGGLGNCIVIQHANGLRTYYGHGNGTFYVNEGQVVKKGEAIMQSGNTGNSSGPHLHFEVRVSPYNWSYGGGDSRRDPRNYL